MEGRFERFISGMLVTVLGGLMLYYFTRPPEQKPTVPNPNAKSVEQANNLSQAPQPVEAVSNLSIAQLATNTIAEPSTSEATPMPTPVVIPDPTVAFPAKQAPAYPSQTSQGRGGISLTIESLRETPNPYIGPVYVATIRIRNSNAFDLSVTIERLGSSEAAAYLTDGAGGSCQMIANGDGWGSLGSAWNPAEDPKSVVLVPAGSSVRRTIFFNTIRCSNRIVDRTDVELSGILIAVIDREMNRIPFSFSGLSLFR